jgi:hypothetical protein
MKGASPHGAVQKGCVGCHHGGAAGLDRGRGHGFAADWGACRSCHGDSLQDDHTTVDQSIALGGRALYRRLVDAGAFGRRQGDGPPSGADPYHATSLYLKGPLGRAAYDVLLVLEDPAAGSHNAPYARTLLDAAKRQLDVVAPLSGGRNLVHDLAGGAR